MGLTLTYDDLTQREYAALEILYEERAEHRKKEQMMDQIREENRAESKGLSF